MKTRHLLFSFRFLKHVGESLIDTFLVLYFLDSSKENIIPLAIYQTIAVVVTYLVIFGMRNLARTKHRAWLMRAGMFFDVLYFLLIIILQEKIARFPYVLGLLRGLEEGFYYSVYNIIESDGVKNEERAKFTGTYKAVSSLSSIIMPSIFGILIYKAGFTSGVAVVLGIIAVRLVISFFYRDRNLPRGKKTNLKKYRELTRRDQRFRWMNWINFLAGLTCSSTAFSSIITIYTLLFFPDSLSLGFLTSLLAIVTAAVGILYAKFIKKKHYIKLANLFNISVFFALVIMLAECNIITIVLFKIIRYISKEFTTLVNDNSIVNLCNDSKIKREYKPEFFVNNERYLVAGRVLSNVLFISMAFVPSWEPIVLIFGFGILGLSYCTTRFQRAVQKRGAGSRASADLAPAFRTIPKK